MEQPLTTPRELASSASATATRTPAIQKDPLDIKVLAAIARSTSSVSPMSLLLATVDWAGHLAMSPGKRMELLGLAWEQWRQLAGYLHANAQNLNASEDTEPIPLPAQDRRFAAEPWHVWPFNLVHQSFLLADAWWNAATIGVPGVSRHHEHIVSFGARQMLDVFSPGNYLFTNPLVLRRTIDSSGANLQQGLMNALADFQRMVGNLPPVGTEAFVVGRDVAATPGKVIFRNRLIELIQYAPMTTLVCPEPVLIVPAWIMKYYILDLSPSNSLIRYLVGRGHTVFCVSWKNPDSEDSMLGMDDYLELGFEAALAAVKAIAPGRKVHAAGYCLGGTLLAIANAAIERDGREPLASMTLFTAQTDFTEPGELALFIDESEVSMLEAQMRDTGYLTTGQMAGAFQLLRSGDLLWSRMVNEYLMGERSPMNDLMAWNADATRMPARMHAQYLRRLFLNDDLSEGRYPVRDKPVALSDIDTPIFCVAALTDHVAPWRSVYKLHYLTPAPITFVLANGGHNAGIVSEPGRPRRHYQLLERASGANYIPPDDWMACAPRHEGSWWPAWTDWLQARSGTPEAPPSLGAAEAGYPALADAPGIYVFEK